ncbi:hypothetical protein [Pseudoponticoccus marisrubri]|uniref:Rod shape-determining protein MreD n=1 Tax=Pseudoponticoccus marisrubri TaxID=1685382 RepID=A0A0W7WPY4_9RHOB|nr:hypothetical protein [Pseudoponticoccus marisrubri]KUF12637.1 rod shape-determining protein MreD [Pseudoponticoccus marisrubri]
MAEMTPGRLWGMRALYILLALLVMFVHLLPMQTLPRGIAGPDLLVAMTFAWALRRPDFVPALSIALVMLLADMLFQRPPGLWSVLVLMGSEFLKNREKTVRENTFFAEWVTVAALLAALTVAYRLALGVLIVAPGTLSLSIMQYGMTVMAYPVVTAVSHVALGVRRSKRGGYDTGRTL